MPKVYVTDSGTKTRRIATKRETKALSHYPVTGKPIRQQYEGINPEIAPSGAGCVECLKSGKGWWLHLRRCAQCGHVGCCDNSPMRHASAHYHIEHHPIIQSYEPGETWFFDYRSGNAINPDVRLHDPQSHPFNQSVPFYVGKDKLGQTE